MGALITPIASKVATATSSAVTTLTRASQFVVFTNIDATNTITVNINGATAVANEGIVLKPGVQITLNLKDIGAYIRSFATISSASTPTLSYMAL